MKLFSLFVPLAVIFALVAQICAADEAALKANRAALKELKGTIRAKRNIIPEVSPVTTVLNTLGSLVIEVAGMLYGLSESANTVADLKEQLNSAVGDAKAPIEDKLQTAVSYSNSLVSPLFGKYQELIVTAQKTITTLPILPDAMKTMLNKTLSDVSANLAGILNGNILDIINTTPALSGVLEAVFRLATQIGDVLTQVFGTLKMLAAGGQTDEIVKNLQQQLSNLTSLSDNLNTLVGVVNKIVAVAANPEDPQLAGLITDLQTLLDTITKDNSSVVVTTPIVPAGNNLVPAVGGIVDQNTNLGVLNG